MVKTYEMMKLPARNLRSCEAGEGAPDAAGGGGARVSQTVVRIQDFGVFRAS